MVATEDYRVLSQKIRKISPKPSIVSQITDDNFYEKVLNQDGLSVVMFTAPWCGPCKIMKNILQDTITSNTIDNVRLMEINTDYNQKYAMEYQVRSIPSFIFIRNGRVVADIVGAVSQEILYNQIEKQRSRL